MKTLSQTARQVEALLQEKGVLLTLGGEPSYVPIEPTGAEWSVTAVGPTKLDYAYKMAHAMIESTAPNGTLFFSPGKSYPGEVNPRWAVHLVWRRDGQPFAGPIQPIAQRKPTLAPVLKAIAKALKIPPNWLRAEGGVAVLPVDFQDGKWVSEKWPFEGNKLTLTEAAGPAGLRLPLYQLPEDALRRALVLEPKKDALHIFLPPLIQAPFTELVAAISNAVSDAGYATPVYEGYVPSDEGGLWQKLSFTPDPGVLEINLPPCLTWAEYDGWLRALEKVAKLVGLRSHKVTSTGIELGTGGGNHLLFGGLTLEDHPFFGRPGWLTSIIRFWQHHPSLSYLFTGSYVGASSQAPRPDESTRELYDLEMAYQFLESLDEGGDHRYLISETLRHLHTDTSGNTHRSEVSLDKFWNAAWEGGCRGLIEFRAVESLPKAEWMSAIALLWKALAATLLARPFHQPLLEHGVKLYDFYFLPTLLWQDFQAVLAELAKTGIELPEKIFAAIWNWRFPTMLQFAEGPATLTIRKALEGWPLLCETPLEGGSTSRFVDTSMERIELIASPAFIKKYRIFAQGRELPLTPLSGKLHRAGLRFRRTALYPSLHPGVAPHMPLFLEFAAAKSSRVFQLKDDSRQFKATKSAPPAHQPTPCRKLKAELLTCDLRLS